MSVTSESPVGGKTLVLLKSELEEQRTELMDALEKLRQEIRVLVDAGPRDVIEESYSSSWAEAVFASYTQSRTQLRKVEDALRRVTTGEFGFCAVCGGDIGLKRLRALSWANTCIRCQERSEQAAFIERPNYA